MWNVDNLIWVDLITQINIATLNYHISEGVKLVCNTNQGDINVGPKPGSFPKSL